MTDKLHQARDAHRAGRLDDAETLYRAALEAEPDNAEAARLLGTLLAQRQDFAAAEKWLRQAIRIHPGDISAHYNLALMHVNAGNHDAALASAERLLTLDPNIVPAHVIRARALLQINRNTEALAVYDWLSVRIPQDAVVHHWRGMCLVALNRPAEALASFDRALAISPDGASMIGLGIVLQKLGRIEDAIAAFTQAAALDPDNPPLQMGLADTLALAGRMPEAIAAFDRVYALAPDTPRLLGNRRHAKMKICDWRDYEKDRDAIFAAIRHGVLAASTLVLTEADPALQRACARLHAAQYLTPSAPIWQGNPYQHERIRVAYVSKDLGDHANIILAAELFELHDRGRFEIFAISLGPDDGSALRKRLESAFEHFHQVEHLDDLDVATLIRRLEIDVAVDLDGYSINARPAVFALRPAPIAVNFLGYPGTIGAAHMDYIIADKILVPEPERQFYDERVVYMPHTYQANTRRAIAAAPMTRAELGLSEKAFVFCCFNNLYKITPAMFDVWMRLLKKVEGSVLWLLGSDPIAQSNLRREATARGIAAERIVFAPRMDPNLHLARHSLADLFLDTLPYNAHTTASDALWAGLPVLTCKGNAFPGRVAASVLGAIGLAELVTNTLEEYEALALALAKDPTRLAAIKERLARNRDTHPLFDSAAYTRDLESAYRSMVEKILS